MTSDPKDHQQLEHKGGGLHSEQVYIFLLFIKAAADATMEINEKKKQKQQPYAAVSHYTVTPGQLFQLWLLRLRLFSWLPFVRLCFQPRRR